MLGANLGGGASAVQERWRVNSEVGGGRRDFTVRPDAIRTSFC
jgi:hypothetical protein